MSITQFPVSLSEHLRTYAADGIINTFVKAHKPHLTRLRLDRNKKSFPMIYTAWDEKAGYSLVSEEKGGTRRSLTEPQPDMKCYIPLALYWLCGNTYDIGQVLSNKKVQWYIGYFDVAKYLNEAGGGQNE